MTDIPYLEPLWLWLRKDENLKAEFTEKSFFMPHADLVQATAEAMAKDCPAPRALWILPQDTLAAFQREDCRNPGTHSFFIQLIIPCYRNTFEPVKQGTELKLGGQFMKLVELRSLVKDSVNAFGKDYKAKGGKKFEKILWVKDQMLYPPESTGFLATAIEYKVTIF